MQSAASANEIDAPLNKTTNRARFRVKSTRIKIIRGKCAHLFKHARATGKSVCSSSSFARQLLVSVDSRVTEEPCQKDQSRGLQKLWGTQNKGCVSRFIYERPRKLKGGEGQKNGAEDKGVRI
eukprot:6214315-Pleurochrysis_carterae.AAC.3